MMSIASDRMCGIVNLPFSQTSVRAFVCLLHQPACLFYFLLLAPSEVPEIKQLGQQCRQNERTDSVESPPVPQQDRAQQDGHRKNNVNRESDRSRLGNG